MKEVFFHTQESRYKTLDEPVICTADNAWLGEAYYFWSDEFDADFWGVKSKRRTGHYEVYEAEIQTDEILDTVFNKEHYHFWLKQIERTAKNFVKKTGSRPSLKEINDYFKDKNIWTKLDGILFQDISKNPVHYLVKEFQYKKRIQLALYNKEKIINFVLRHTGECT